MKKLAFIFAVAISSFGFGQVDLGDNGRFQYLLDSANRAEAMQPCIKQGDNDIALRSMFKIMFTDSAAFNLIRHHASLNNNFYVLTGKSVRHKMLFGEWIVNLRNLYTSTNYIVEYEEFDYDGDMVIRFYSADKVFVSSIVIYWDRSHDGITFSNIRHISDIHDYTVNLQ